MLKSRLLRDIERRQADEDALAEFAALLLEVLHIPEVRAAIAAISKPSSPVVSAANRKRTRG